MKYLGFNISLEGKHLDETRKTAILRAPKPQTKKQMMSSLGMTYFCRAWIANYAEVTHPLQMLIYDQPMAANGVITWTPGGEHVFVQVKQLLVSSGVLALPDYKKNIYTNV